jgi:hypothetical protein
MNLPHLWWTGIVHPTKAFDELKAKPAPVWGFWVVLVFNLLISATTLLTQYLLHRPPFLESWLTFLPTDRYFLPEMFFLPPLRVLVWLMGAAMVHLGLRLARQTSDIDLILNIGALGTLVIMPVILVSDWLLIVSNAYFVAEFTHPVAALWGLVLTAIGVKRLLGVKSGFAFLLALISTLLSIPFLAIFAR